jgi:biopolymer transport protein ExbB/TolQ
MLPKLSPEAVKIGRLEKKIRKLKQQLAASTSLNETYKEVLNNHSWIDRAHKSYKEALEERERIRNLEARVKEQSILIRKLTE